MDEKEIWLPIKGYEGIYEVSTLGNVKSLGRDIIRGSGLYHLPLRVLKPVTMSQGYLRVNLYKDGKGRTKLVHRLVAEAFLPNPNDFPELNHIDECKSNNAVTNLEWCDRAYNCNFGSRNERVAATKSKPIQQLTNDDELVAEYPSAREAARQTGFNQSNISRCCNGGKYLKGKWQNLHSYKGFKWRYA